MADVLISKSRSGQFIQGVKAPSTPSFVNGENPVPVDSGGDAGGGSFVPQTRELSINGTVFDLSQDRAWTIPTHDAVSIGTGNGLSLSGQVLSLGLASAITNGALSSTDWNAFNNKVSSRWGLNGTSIFYNGGNVGIGTDSPTTKLAFGIGDVLGEIGRVGFDVAGNQRAYIRADRRVALGQLTDLHFGTMGSDRLTIDNNGNVGIGTSSPVLSLAGTFGQTIYNTSNAGISLATGGGLNDYWLMYRNGSNGSLQFFNEGTTKIMITSSGNVLIGTTTDNGAKLQVSGDIRINQNFGLMLIAPNGNRYKVTVDNSGTLVTTLT